MKGSCAWLRRGALGMAAVAAAVCCVDGAEAAGLRTQLTDKITFQLPGDAHQTSLVPDWELQLDPNNNADANENQMSMAVSGDYLYVCICYFSNTSERNRNLFMRRYSLLDGSETELLVPVPDDFRQGYVSANNYYTIASDDAGNLIAALVKTLPASDGTTPVNAESALLTLYRIDTATNSIDTGCRYSAIVNTGPIGNVAVGSEVSDMTWLERINWHSGSISSGDFEFSAAMGWRESERTGYVYRYFTFGRQAGDTGSDISVLSSTAIAGDTEYSDVLKCPDVACYPPFGKNAGHMVVTFNGQRHSGESLANNSPTLFVDGAESGVLPIAKEENCRGFHPFIHNGHVLAVYAGHHDRTNGAQFNLISWPDKNAVKTVTQLAAFPQNPFESLVSIYEPRIRQLAVAVPDKTGRAGESAVNTHLYVCAPGSGVAAYTISTPMTSTGIEAATATDDNSITFSLCGRRLTVNGMAAETPVELFDLSGRLVHVVNSGSGTSVNLDALANGIYVVRVGSAVSKIELR